MERKLNMNNKYIVGTQNDIAEPPKDYMGQRNTLSIHNTLEDAVKYKEYLQGAYSEALTVYKCTFEPVTNLPKITNTCPKYKRLKLK